MRKQPHAIKLNELSDQSKKDYYSQAGALFRIMNDGKKIQLFGNIASGLKANVSIQERMLAQFTNADPA